MTFPDGKKYHDDVAFGGDGPIMPLPLIDGPIYQNLGTQQIRLVRDWIPTQVHRTEDSKLWMYQYRNNAGLQWNSFYSFPGVEFLTLDWGVVNFWVCNHPTSHQRFNVLTVKFLRRLKDESSEEYEIYGRRMLVNGTVKENLGGMTQAILECDTEDERISALDTYFDIRVTDEEKQGIKGYQSEISQVIIE